MKRTAVVLVLAAALTGCGGSGPAGTGGSKVQTVQFQKPLDPGPAPFTAPADVRGRVTQPISQPFGGSGSNRVCDRDKLMRFLRAHPDRMYEWARVLHVQPTYSAVKRYIAKLHPVTLTRDTQVTNHAFKNGRAVPFQAILQAGTAVLVDRYGRPVVRCYCGNPLGPAVYTPTSRCVDCPPHYRPPRQCRYGRFDNYDVVYYRRTYYSNASYDETYIRLSRRGRYRNCYAAYPDPPTVTIVDVFNAPPPPEEPVLDQAPPPAATTTPHDDGLHCNPPRSQLEFEQCNGIGHDDDGSSSPPPTQHSPTHTETEQMPALPQVGECNNGVDDDGDGMTDTGDPGCSSPSDQSE